MRRVVIKVGSAQLIDPESGLARTDRFRAITGDIARLQGDGSQVVLVSSGAVALGRQRLKTAVRTSPAPLSDKQAAAAAGQPALIGAWDRALQSHGLMAAQALLTPGDTEVRRRWLNARDTLEALLAMGAVPIINENDTVATDELRFGDNDRLAARVAQMIDADTLFILSDVDGLYDGPPHVVGAQHIPHVQTITPEIEAMAGPATGSVVGTGGMASKIAAARIAVAAGCEVVIASGAGSAPVRAVSNGVRHTRFAAASTPERARQAWIRGLQVGDAVLVLDEGACAALRQGKSLLPTGVLEVRGTFERGAAVRLASADGAAIATGITRYGHEEARRISGLKSDAIEGALGYSRGAVIVHVDDLVLDGASGGGHP